MYIPIYSLELTKSFIYTQSKSQIFIYLLHTYLIITRKSIFFELTCCFLKACVLVCGFKFVQGMFVWTFLCIFFCLSRYVLNFLSVSLYLLFNFFYVVCFCYVLSFLSVFCICYLISFMLKERKVFDRCHSLS
jgi:hypothetical protein